MAKTYLDRLRQELEDALYSRDENEREYDRLANEFENPYSNYTHEELKKHQAFCRHQGPVIAKQIISLQARISRLEQNPELNKEFPQESELDRGYER